MQVSETAQNTRDGKAKTSVLAQEDVNPFSAVNAIKGKSATDRAKKRRLARTDDLSTQIIDDLMSLPQDGGVE